MPETAESKTLKQLGANIRAERRKKGISQEALADLAELDRSYVGGVERGERNIAVLNIVRLARALGIAPGSLLKGL